ncbi:hypothetical protein BDR22DRAFT_818096 [Usnea florida]
MADTSHLDTAKNPYFDSADTSDLKMNNTSPFDPTDGTYLTLPDGSHFDISGIELVGDSHYETADGQVWSLANTDYLGKNSFAMDTITSGTPDAASSEIPRQTIETVTDEHSFSTRSPSPEIDRSFMAPHGLGGYWSQNQQQQQNPGIAPPREQFRQPTLPVFPAYSHFNPANKRDDDDTYGLGFQVTCEKVNLSEKVSPTSRPLALHPTQSPKLPISNRNSARDRHNNTKYKVMVVEVSSEMPNLNSSSEEVVHFQA